MTCLFIGMDTLYFIMIRKSSNAEEQKAQEKNNINDLEAQQVM